MRARYSRTIEPTLPAPMTQKWVLRARRIYVSMPQLSTVRTKMTARVGWMRFRSAIGSGMLRSDSPNLRVVGRSGPISRQKRAPDTVGIHGQAKQRQVCLSNEGRDDVALSIVIYVTQCLPAGSGMALKDGDACL
ncbi:MAG: hypothetical protein OXC68_04445 [Aestuariivita sp.]|nr:hypothetical protein [Aestuariivita sp.]